MIKQYKIEAVLLLVLLNFIGMNKCFAQLDWRFHLDYSGRNVLYVGEINTHGAESLIRIMRKRNSNKLFINSGGGSSEAGMMIGEYVSKKNISVVAVNKCYSSCANYIFLPSKDKYMLSGAKVGLHGGAQSYHLVRLELLERIPNEYRNYYLSAIDLESVKMKNEMQLLRDSGVNPEIILHSAKMTLFGSAKYSIKSNDGVEYEFSLPERRMSKYELWFPDGVDYDKWGLVINDYQYSQVPTKFKSRIVKMMKNDDDFIVIGG